MNASYDFGSGRADPDTIPVDALKAAATRAIDACGRTLAEYPGALGHAGLRTAMARREAEREGVEVNPDHLLLTNGSMQAVTLAARALLDKPGDTVLLEEFSYPGTLTAYRNLGLTLEGVPLTPEGMCLDTLEQQLTRLRARGRQARFIYVISTYQNPTGFVMPRANRLRLVELGRRFGVPIVEDNCYADVHFEGPVEPALYALDDSQDVLYTSSLSKILAPGLRLGYVLVRPPRLEQLTARRDDAGSNTLAAAIAAEFYRDGIRRHADHVNAALRIKRDRLLDALTAHLEDLCVWSRPPGGLFVWVRIPDDVDRDRLRHLCQEADVNYLPGASFHHAGQDVPYLRLAFGHLRPATIDEGVERLAGCLRRARRSNARREFETLF